MIPIQSIPPSPLSLSLALALVLALALSNAASRRGLPAAAPTLSQRLTKRAPRSEPASGTRRNAEGLDYLGAGLLVRAYAGARLFLLAFSFFFFFYFLRELSRVPVVVNAKADQAQPIRGKGGGRRPSGRGAGRSVCQDCPAPGWKGISPRTRPGNEISK